MVTKWTKSSGLSLLKNGVGLEMGQPKGYRPGGAKSQAGKGRIKGVKNKFTNLKESFLSVYKELGGDEFLKEFAQDNPGDYLKMLSVMLPRNQVEEIKQDIRISWGQDPSLSDPTKDAIDVTPSSPPLPANSNKVSKSGKE